MLELKKYNATNANYRLAIDILANLKLSDNLDNAQREKLDNTKTSIYLMEFVIEMAKEIQDKVGLRYLVLLPDNERLQSVYKDMGFQVLPKQEWMFIKL